MPGKRDLRRLTRGLRFRLTATYALFFTVLLVGVAFYFRESLERAAFEKRIIPRGVSFA